ncbi:MAG TPA: prolipoprotein diacylglyceryl transferase [Erysipelotrichaceae bacterium]|nr:prolipoprotein diacylglyceryl transferase [Erysipelotrichaceae bacterium]
MYNDWLKIGPLTVHGYGVMIAVGVLAAIWLAEKLAEKFDLEKDSIDSMIFFILVCAFALSKLTYCLTVLPQFLKDPLSVLGSGGWVVYGGVLGGIFAAWIWCRWHHWDFMKYLNTLIVTVPMAQGFGRIGCFFAGCCYGHETTAWYGVRFPADSLCPLDTAVIPTQLISSAGDFLIFAVLYWNLMHGKHSEDNGAWYLILYSIGRFMIEFLRGDINRGFIGSLSTSQFIAVFAALFGAWLIYRRQKNTMKENNI